MRDSYFLHTAPLSGHANMAIDAFLLEECVRLQSPILRVYSWIRPTLSLGYFQKLEDVADPNSLPALGVDWVKRMTGGGAILHHREVTLSLALPESHGWLRGSVDDSYKAFAAPLLGLLQGLGMAASFRGECRSLKAANCFAGAACADLVIGADKVFGAAQRRRGGGVLTHASLLLGLDQALWTKVFGNKAGQGYAAVGFEGLDWAALILGAYGKAFGQALVENRELHEKSMLFENSGQAQPPVLS